MGTGWRRAFCTSIRRDPDTAAVERSPDPSPRSCAKLSFFSGNGGSSNPSTPRLRSLRCRTKSTHPESPKLQCKTATVVSSRTSPPPTSPKRSPTLLRRGSSNPSSPRSPSTFAIFKAALHLSRSRCVICAQSVKAGGGTAVFTAECSHAFHFPCIAAHVRSNGGGTLTCPVCSASWRQAPFLSSLGHHQDDEPHSPVLVGDRKPLHCQSMSREDKRGGREAEKRRPVSAAPAVKVYDDDEPLLPSTRTTQGGANVWFNPIPEADEDDDDGGHEDAELEAQEEEEFHRFLTKDYNNNNSNCSRSPSCRATAGTTRAYAGGLEVSVIPEAALVSSGRKHRNYVVALKVKAPAASPLLSRCHRAPIDLVTVLDVSGGMTGAKIQMLKRAMRQVISSLGHADRLSVVAFSSVAAKRLLPLRRMSRPGQRSARLIVERLVASGDGQGSCVGDALRKATKVLEDRRERNPVATIMLLSDGQQQQRRGDANKDGRSYARYPSSSAAAVTTRFAHLEIPIHASGFGDVPQQQPPKHSSCLAAPVEDAFAKCVGGLVSVVMQDVRLQIVFPAGEVSAVYSGCGRAAALGSSVRLGDLYAEEEWELLVELRVPTAAGPGHHQHSLSVKCRYRDPATQEVICGVESSLLLPPLQSLGHPLLTCSASSISLRLRNLFVTTRAVAESRRLTELSDYATALHLLSSARSLLLLSPAASDQDQDLIRRLEVDLADIQRRRGAQQQPLSPCQRRREEATIPGGEQQQLTPTSAWRAAEQLAKVAIMRKSLNRISDLHGFENARF